VFYFEQLFQTALNGIDDSNVTTAVLTVAATILLLSFLYSVYQAFAAGGDVRMLAISGIKYLILGLVFASYGSVFRDVNRMFNSAADFISSSTGVGDLFARWMDQLAQYWLANGNVSLWNLVTGLASGVISLGLILGAFVIFPVCYLIFSVLYAMYGAVLYVTGPLVLAMLPARGLGQLSRAYLVNLMTFQAWGLIYAVLQVLMSAVNLSSIDAVLGSGGVLSSFVGSSQMILLALTATVFSFAIVLIPFIANRIVQGEVGSTMMTLASSMTMAASTAAGAVAASFAGAEGRAGAVSGGGSSGAPPPPASVPVVTSLRDSAWGDGRAGASSGASATSTISPTPPAPGPATAWAETGDGPASEGAPAGSSAPPGPPASGESGGGPGPHGLAWRIGYSLGSTFRELRGNG
jgi:hypothetical protein